jgi:hypothetical protein
MSDAVTSDLRSALESLRENLRRWGELHRRAAGAARVVSAWKERQERLDFDNRVDPANAAERTAQLEADGRFLGRDGGELQTVEEYTALVEAFQQGAPAVAAAAEGAGIDTGALLLFVADLDDRHLEAARTVVERVAVLPSGAGLLPASEGQWLPAAQAVNKAEQAGHPIRLDWLTRDAPKQGVKVRARQLPGNHKKEVEWNSLAGYLMMQKSGEAAVAGTEGGADDPPDTERNEIERRKEEEQRRKRHNRSLD